MNKSLQLIRPDLQNFTPYSSARDEAKHGKIWLNANESPWNDQADIALNRYPKKQPRELFEQLAFVYNVAAEQILLSRGSDEAIDLLIRLFCRAEKDAVMISSPTFGMYKVCAQLQAAKVIDCPLEKRAEFDLDIEKIINTWTSEVKIIFICSPNNPTGNLINKTDILRLCEVFQGKSLIVVDEAYIEFADTESLSSDIARYDNLVILRTFSKAFGLAAARCGLVLAQGEIIQYLSAIMPPYPLSTLTTQAVAAAIMPSNFQKILERVQCIKQQRDKLSEALSKLPFIRKVWPSQANFLLVEVEDADQLMDVCKRNEIILRNMNDKSNLENCVRITIGSPEENVQLVMVMQQMQGALQTA